MTDKLTVTQATTITRNVKFDIAKGICMILILSCHAGMPYNKIFTLFFVSTFFIISGYFFKPSYCNNWESLKFFIKKRFKDLIIPFIVCNGIFILCSNLLIDMNIFLNSNFIEQPKYLSLKEILEQFIGVLLLAKRAPLLGDATWFLKALFFVAIGYAIGYFLLKKLKIQDNIFNLLVFSICLICSLLGCLFRVYHFNFYHIGTIFSCVFFYYLGILYKKYEEKIPVNNITAILAIIILIVESNLAFIDLQENEYTNLAHLYICTIAGAQFVFWISNLIEKKSVIITKILSYTGRHTISILCLHFLAFKLVSLLQINIYSLPVTKLKELTIYTIKGWWVAYIFAGVAIPLLLNEIYLRIKLKLLKIK